MTVIDMILVPVILGYFRIPGKTNTEPDHGGLEGEFPFHFGVIFRFHIIFWEMGAPVSGNALQNLTNFSILYG